MAEQPANTGTTRQLLLQKIYVKDLSFESPKAPAVFSADVNSQTQLNMRSAAREIAPNTQEVTLTLTVEAKDQDSTLFLVEISQAGIFTIEGYSEQERSMLIGSYCPGTLYPYAREAISDVVVKGGFPQLLLQPINFDALYAQAVQQQRQQQAGGGAPQVAQPFQGQFGAQPGGGGAQAGPDASGGDGANSGSGGQEGGAGGEPPGGARPDETH